MKTAFVLMLINGSGRAKEILEVSLLEEAIGKAAESRARAYALTERPARRHFGYLTRAWEDRTRALSMVLTEHTLTESK